MLIFLKITEKESIKKSYPTTKRQFDLTCIALPSQQQLSSCNNIGKELMSHTNLFHIDSEQVARPV